MSREQIEEMALELCRPRDIVKMIHHRTCGNCDTSSCDIYELCVDLYNAGYRKVKKGSWNVIKPSRENGEPSYICSVCGALYHEDVREWKGCPKCLSEMKGGAQQ